MRITCCIVIFFLFIVYNHSAFAQANMYNNFGSAIQKNPNRICDNTKIRHLPSFAPNYDMQAGLAKTIDWFIKPENLAKYKHDIYNL